MKKQSKQYDNSQDPANQIVREDKSSLESHNSQKGNKISRGGDKTDATDSRAYCGGNSNEGNANESHLSDGSPRMGGGVRLDMNLNGVEVEGHVGATGNDSDSDND